MTAQHSMITDEHGSPPSFVNLARAVMRGIDVDPASSAIANRNVRATRFIDAKQDFRVTPWFEGAPAPNRLRTNPARAPSSHTKGRTFGNPPSDKRGVLVARFWWLFVEYFELGWITSGIYVGFNVEQLSRLQRVGARSHPLEHVTLIPRKREDYIDLETGELQEDAPHASFVTLLSRSSREIETFAALGSELGHVVNGDRR